MEFPNYPEQMRQAITEANSLSAEITRLKNAEHTRESGKRVYVLIKAFEAARKKEQMASYQNDQFIREFGREYLEAVYEMVSVDV